jgi:hypothetical protein
MEKISDTQREIEYHHSKLHDRNFKQDLRYLKFKAHKMNKNLVTILSNMSTTMCHKFIKDQELLLPQVDIYDYSEVSKDFEDKQPIHNLHVFSDEKKKMLLKNECGQKMMFIRIYKIWIAISNYKKL